MATVSKPLPLPHLRELDGIRGIAALLVFFHHVCYVSVPHGDWNWAILALRRVSMYGTTGVDVFFVLSGFLITSLLIRDRQSPAYYKDFYWKRALRILPLYIACLLGVLLFIPHSAGYVLLSAFFVANFANIVHVASHGPFWSLAIEEQFYLIWPTVVRRRSAETLGHWAVAIAATAILLRFAAATFGHYNYFLTFLRCDGLAAGALIACRMERRQREQKQLSADDRYFGLALAAGVLLVTIAGLFINPDKPAFVASVQQTAVTLISAAVVGLSIAHTGSPILAPLRSHLLTFFGLISYAFYMLHLYVLETYDHVSGPVAIGDTTAYTIRLSVVFGLSIALSLLSRYALELPALSLRKRVLSRPAPKAETETPLFSE